MRNYTKTDQHDELDKLLPMKSNRVWTRNYPYNFENSNDLLGHDLQNTTDSYEYERPLQKSMPHLPEQKYDYADQLRAVLNIKQETLHIVKDKTKVGLIDTKLNNNNLTINVSANDQYYVSSDVNSKTIQRGKHQQYGDIFYIITKLRDNY